MSTDSGVQNAPLNALAIGGKAFALFTRNPARWASKKLADKDIAAFRQNCADNGYDPAVILPHDSYLINLGSPDQEKLVKSRNAFLDEIQRASQLGLTMVNFHPGSHLKLMEEEACLDLIAESINLVLGQTEGVKAVIENTAGQGTNLGWRFEHIARIIDGIADKSRVGVCIDTCHTLAAGYDLSSAEGYAATWRDFDDIIGHDYLCGIHLNDSKKGAGSHVDRHAPIGEGELGMDFFRRFVNDPRFENMPIILETPDPDRWADEISLLYGMIEQPTN